MSHGATERAVHHGPTVQTYIVVFVMLLALTGLAVVAAYAPFPPAWHTPVAFAIAGIKATLVLLFFMHLLYGPRLFWLVAFGSLVWLGIMVALTLADYLTRAWMSL